MKSYRKIMLVALVLLAILTLGAVSASDADSESLAVDDVGGSDSVASPVDDADLLSDGNGTVSNPDPDDGDEGTDFDDDGDEGGDEIEKIWVDESDLSLDDENLGNHFAYVNTPEDAEGYVLVNCGETVFFNKTLSSMDQGADEQNEGYYWHGISLNDVGKFDGLKKEDMIIFSLFDGDGQKVQSRIYFIYFGENTIQLQNDDSENLDDYTTVEGLTFSLMENMNIEDSFSVIKVAVFPDGIADSFSISLQKDDDAIVTNWTLDSVERDRAGYAMWNIQQLGISEVGVYSINFIFNIGNNTAVINVGNVNMGSEEGGDDVNPDDFDIVFYEDGVYDNLNDGETRVVDFIVPEGSEGNIYVTAKDSDWILDIPITYLDVDDEGVYYLVPDSFDHGELDYGTFEITASYILNDKTIVSKSGVLTFKEEDEDEPGSDGEVIYTENNTFDAIADAIISAKDGDIINLSNFDEYDIGNSTIPLTKNLTFIGNGNTVIKGHGISNGLINVRGVVNIQGIKFVCTHPSNNFTYGGSSNGIGIRFFNVAGGSVSDCEFVDFDQSVRVQGSSDVVIENNYFHGGSATALINDPSVNKEKGTRFIQVMGSKNTAVINNIFDGPVLDAISIASASNSNIIEDNSFINNAYSIYIGGASSNNSVIRNNTFTNCGSFKEGDIDYKGLPVIDMSKSSSNIAIEDNVFNAIDGNILITAEQGNDAYGNPSVLEDVSVTGNKVVKSDDEASGIILLHLLVRESQLNEDNTLTVEDNDVDEDVTEYALRYYVDGLTFEVHSVELGDEGIVLKVIDWPSGIKDNFVISVVKEDSEPIETSWNINTQDWTLADLGIEENGIYEVTFYFTKENDDELSVKLNCNINVGGEEDDEDSFEVWIDTDAEFDSSSDLSGYVIGSVTVPENSIGNISIITDDGDGLFNKPLNDFDSDDIRENTYDIRLTDNGRYIFEGLGDGTVFKFVFLDEEGNEKWGSSYYRLVVEDNIIRFGEIHEDEHGPDAWINYEDNGKIYTDTQQGVVAVSVPYGTEGTVYVEINGEIKGSWETESYDEEYDSYHDWTLEDLEISEEGTYAIVVKLNDEILKTENITVYEFNNDEFRFIFDFEGKIAKLYCPEGIEGTLTVTTIKYFDEDSDEVYWNSFNLANVTGWSDWDLMDLGLEYDDVWTEFIFNIANDEDELFTVNKKVRCSYDDAEYHINIWDEFDERGPLYTDSEGNVVGIDVSRSFDGNVIIYVNGKEIDNWNVEFDDEDGWAYHDWGLEDLGISKADNYTIEVVRDNGEDTETLLNKTITVYDFNDDTYRAMILYAAESIKLYIPDGAQGTVSIVTEKENEDGDLDEMGEVTYDITSDDYGNWKEWSLADLGFEADGAFRVFTLTVRDTNDEVVYRYRISHVDGEDEEGGDDYEEQIEFAFVTLDDDGYMEFNKTSDADVARLYIPDTDEFRGVVGTVTVRLNGEIIKTIKTDEFEDGNYNNHYPIVLDLSTLKDKDMLSFTVEALYENGDSAFDDEDEDEEHVWILILEDKGTYFIGHDDYDPERLEFDVFFGNLTTNHTNNPELMGANFGDNFVIVTISNALEITEGTITVTDEKSNVIFSKQLSDCDKTYDYGSEGYTYSILLSEVKDKLPEGTNLTVTFSYANGSLTQKRIRFEDYLYTFVTLEDIERQFYFEINDDLLLHPSDNAINLWTDTNRQSIYINLGGGYFTVYVNGVKVENLGNVSFNTWKDDGSWRYDDRAYEENDYPIGDDEEYPNEEAFLDYVRSYWGSELELFRLTSWNQGAPEIRITLADLGITESGTYNIRIVHYPSVPGGLDDHSSIGIESQYAEEMLNPTYTEVLNANITCNLDPDYAGVEILKERVYKNGQPFLFNFQFGDNVFSESNRILVYLNDELAFNSTTLFWEENDEGEMELVELWHLNDGLFNEEFLNDYGVLDAGEYEVVVYLVKGDAAPVEISRGNFTVLTQRGDMNFTIGYDDEAHTILYADIPEGNWDDYSLEIVIDDSEKIFPNEDDWFARWYDEYVIFKDNGIFDKQSLADVIGKGPVAIDLGVLPKGTHIWVALWHGEETIYGDWDFYQNDFIVDYPSIAANVTKDNFFDFFDEDGVLTAVLTDITFIGDFTGLEVASIIINKPVVITGEDATFTDVSFNIDSDDVAISGISLKYTTPEDTDAYAIVAYNVANFLMENNTIAYIGLTDGTFTNNALRINGGSNIKIRNNAFVITIPSAGVNWVEEDGVWNSYPVSEGIVFNDCEDVEFDANIVDVRFNKVVGSDDKIYSIDVKNSNKVAITNNNIRATGKTYIYGITISAEDFEISDNAINVTSEYYVSAIDVEGPASGVVDNNTIDAAAPNSVYGIYATSFEGPSTVDFTYNTITGEGYYVVGIFDDSELIKGNVIKLTGNHTIGIAVLSEASVEDNTIILDASNIGNEALSDAVNPETVGIYVTNDAFITNNKVVSTAKSIIVLNGTSTFSNNDLTGFVSINSDYNVFENNSVVTDNEYAVEVNATENMIVDNFLSAKDLTGDDAVYAIEGNTIKDNRGPGEEIESRIELSNIEFTYNETGSADVTLFGVTAIMAEVVGHDEAKVTFADGKLTVSGLDAGNYTLKITTVPEEGYFATTKLVNITVNKADIPLTVDVDVSAVRQNGTVYITVRAPSDAVVKLLRNGNTYEAVSVFGAAYYEFYYEKTGSQTITVQVEGDKNHNNAEVDKTFDVPKFTPEILITTGEAIEGSDLDVYVDMADATGVVSINGVNVTLTDGKASTTIKNVTAGDLAVDVAYFGDDKYTNASNSTTVAVKAKQDAGLDVSVADISVGQSATVSIVINANVTGKVTIDGTEVTIADGKGTFTIDNLAAGEHTVTAVFAGDKYFKADEKTAAFTVTKLAAPAILITTDEAIEGSDLDVYVDMADATGVVSINGVNVTLTGGKASTTIKNVTAGDLAVNVVYYGDDKYTNASNSTTVVVKAKQDAGLDVSVDNINVGQSATVSIVINANVTGKVTIDGTEVTIADGKGTFTIDNLAAGEHTVTAVFAGDKYFKADEKTAAFTVTKLDSPISIDIPKSQYTAFDNFQITIGNVTAVAVTINSKTYAVKADGTVDIDTTALDAGAYTVVVSNVETATYKANSTSKSFTIVKKASEVSIDVGASYNVGDDFAIEIDNTTAATVTINGNPYEIKDGKVVVDTTALSAGEYTVFASIAGDGKYLASNATATFNVNKLAAPAILITHGEAIEGSDMAVDVTIVGASGVVNINGKNITLADAKATTTFTDLLAGNMVVNVLYFGDAKYLGASNSSTIVVKAKENAGLKVTVSDIKVGETAVVNVEINSEVTGKVTINGNDVTIAEGKGTFTISGLSAGEYNVTAIFAGDKYFNAGNATATFKVSKVETPANDNTTIPLDGAAKESKTPTYTISLPSDATGTLTVTVDGKNYTAEVVNGQASVPVPGLSAGNHKVTITYSGDSKYSPIVKSTTTNVVVDPKVVIKQSTVSYTAKYSATVYGKDGKVAKNTNVVFYINGKKIKTAQTNSKGVATFNLPNNYLPNKKYTIKATALGKSASKKVTVKQVLTLRKAEIKKSKNLVLIASVKKIDGKYPKGKVTFYLNGKKVKSVSISSKGIAKGTISKSKFNKLSVGSRMTYKAVYLKASVQKNTKLKT